ncbi:MAG TPA: hypothetical protein VMU97_00980 [Candidatus Dormibacteraeota bacterium]|nr:hypothetical protein [Candidatus Dormibacteraeota bacterium]
MDSAKQQLIDKLKSANNVLVTVSRGPSVDQLAACIGLSLLLNKQGKHAAAVFSGEVPSTLEFLQPGETLEKNTDSLRDFIISLDRSKADKLRYKVEDNVVRIFITPYKTSISQEDLEFSEGDFNVDLVIALGVHRQEDLDEAITAHGRILHDATVATVNITPDGDLGTINWFDPQASSLSELVAELTQALGDDLLDNQIATALLTGIVSETERFGNDKTSSQTMSVSAALMAAGANQQLVASKLEEPETAPVKIGEDEAEGDKGALKINHDNDEEPNEPIALPPNDADQEPDSDSPSSGVSPGPKLVTEPPTMGGTLTANSTEEKLEPPVNPMSLPTTEPPLLDHAAGGLNDQPPAGSADDATAQLSNRDDMTLTEIEEAIGSPHLKAEKEESVDEARDEVNQALSDSTDTSTPEPIQALNAQPLGGDLHPGPSAPAPGPTLDQILSPADDQTVDPNAPPPVPPPFVPPQPPQSP